jgi:CcmD family protein
MENNSIYIVVAVVSVIFIGIAFYLFTIDRQVRDFEKEKATKDHE